MRILCFVIAGRVNSNMSFILAKTAIMRLCRKRQFANIFRTINKMMNQNMETAFSLHEFLAYRLMATAQQTSYSWSLQYADEFGLTVPEWRILATLAEAKQGNNSPAIEAGITAKRLGELTLMDKSKVSRALKLMEEKQLVIKATNGKDKRAYGLLLSAAGRAMFAAIVPKAKAWERQLIDVLSASEYRDFMRCLDKLDAHIKSALPD